MNQKHSKCICPTYTPDTQFPRKQFKRQATFGKKKKKKTGEENLQAQCRKQSGMASPKRTCVPYSNQATILEYKKWFMTSQI